MKIKLEVAYTNEETISQLDSALEEIEDIKVEKALNLVKDKAVIK